MVRNFEKFQEGHWYIYTGSERPYKWNRAGNMDFVLDHKPRICFNTRNPFDADFEGNYTWDWEDGFDNWIEIRDPNKSYSVVVGSKYYDSNSNKVHSGISVSQTCSGKPCYALIDSIVVGEKEKNMTIKTFSNTNDIKQNLKVGDRVRIHNIDKEWEYFCNPLLEYVGEVVTIIDVVPSDNLFRIQKQENSSECWNFPFSSLLEVDIAEYMEDQDFKVGDKVKIVKKDTSRELIWSDSMDACIGKVGEITDIKNETLSMRYRVLFNNEEWFYNIESLKKVSPESRISLIDHSVGSHRALTKKAKFTPPKQAYIQLNAKKQNFTIPAENIEISFRTKKNIRSIPLSFKDMVAIPIMRPIMRF
jgi:hypothetical protein